VTVSAQDNGGTAVAGDDDTSPAQTFIITVNAVNDAPVVSVPADPTVLEDGTLTISGIAVTDVDAGTDPLDVSLSVTSGTLDFTGGTDTSALTDIAGQGTGTLTFKGVQAAVTAALAASIDYSPGADFNGSATLNIAMSDQGSTGSGGAQTGNNSIDITVTPVNDQPTLAISSATYNHAENGGTPHEVLNFATPDMGPPDEDAGGANAQAVDDYVITITSGASLFAPGGEPDVANNGTLTYTIAVDANGSATIDVQVRDNGGEANGGVDLSVAQTLNITVGAVNDEPSVTLASAAITVLEDQFNTTVANFATFDAGPPDEDAAQAVDDYIVTVLTGASLFSVAPDIDNNGQLTYILAADANGTATLTVAVRDDGTTGGDNDELSPDVSLTINVTAVNDEPDFTKGADQTVFRGDGAIVVPGWATALDAGPDDEDAAPQTLSFNVVADDPSLFSVLPAIDASGQLTYTADPTQTGVATVTVSISDDGGTADGGDDTSADQTFTITIDSTRIYIPDLASAGLGATVTVPVNIDAFGTEHGVSFSVNHDPAVLSFSSAALDANATGLGGVLLLNEADTGNGNLGLAIVLQQGTTFTALTDQGMVNLTFTVENAAPLGASAITLTGAPVFQEITDTNADPLPNVDYDHSSISIEHGTKEGDVAVRPNGDGNVSITDMTQIGRFVAGLDTPAQGAENGEFQRADIAPRSTGGGGSITVSDWVQAGRYAAGFDQVDHDTDPGTPDEIPDAFGPVSAGFAPASFGMPSRSAMLALQTDRAITVQGRLITGSSSTVSVMLNAQGDETGISFTLQFDPDVLTYESAVRGDGVAGAMLIVNGNNAAAGRVGIVLGQSPGQAIGAGSRELVKVIFRVAVNAPTATTLSVNGNSPVAREVSGLGAQVLPANFRDASLPIELPTGFNPGVPVVTNEGLRFTFGKDDGSPVTAMDLANLEVYATSDIGAASWTRLDDALVIVNGQVQIVDPEAGKGIRFYQVRRTATSSDNGGSGQQNQ
jgi:hypothetical protein